MQGAVGVYDVQPHVLPDHTVDQLPRVRQQDAQVDDPRRDHLLPAEAEELLHERGGAVPGASDLVRVVAPGVVRSELRGQKVRISYDGGQEVVEVVGDAAGQPAHGLELLRVAKLFLQFGLDAYFVRQRPVGVGDVPQPSLERPAEKRAVVEAPPDGEREHAEDQRREIREPQERRPGLTPHGVGKRHLSLGEDEDEERGNDRQQKAERHAQKRVDPRPGPVRSARFIPVGTGPDS